LSSHAPEAKRGGEGTWQRRAQEGLARIPQAPGDVVLALLFAAVAVLVRLVLDAPLGGYQPFITVYPGLLILALFRSSRSAALYVVLSGLALVYLFLPNRNSFAIPTTHEAIVALAFIMVAAMLLGLSHSQRRWRERLEHEAAVRREAEKRVRDLNEVLEIRVRERTHQLEEVNRELEAFSYSVSHDLRAPLRHIAGFNEMLIKRIGGAESGLDETSRRYVGVINDAVGRAGALVDDLLAFSRMGRADLLETQVNTRAMVDEILREFESDTRERDIQWKIGNLPDVHADPAMLRLVWRNLIGNAVKYSRPARPPEIEIGTLVEGEHLERAGEQTGESQPSVIFFVGDNGVGFDMKYSDKLFGVFQRLHRSDEFEGTGIGLANVRRIIQRHGGRTWAQASLGNGATFYFSLPAHRERTEV
jgi:signal transduction histidine kinase